MTRIALDVMGGDNAPHEIVKGAIKAAGQLHETVSTIYMVGDEKIINGELKKFPKADMSRLKIVHASEQVNMNETPAKAVREKKDCSINVAMRLVKNGEADAFVSAGNSGAVSAAAILHLGRIKGVMRPAIATVLPTSRHKHPVLVLDAGANTDCSEDWLAQFAIMGDCYSRGVLKRNTPSVGLLSIGSEDCKGNAVTKEAFKLIQNDGMVNFCGNVEGHDIFGGELDVVVCDGFVGNVVLKTTESVAHAVGDWLKHELRQNPIRLMGALLLRGAFKALKRKMNPEIYGGAPLLGVPKTVIITHGSSHATAIYHAVIAGSAAAANDVSGEIEKRIAAVIDKRAEDKGSGEGPGQQA